MANKVLGIENGSAGSDITVEKSSSGLFYFFQKAGSLTFYVLAQDIDQTDDQIVSTPGIPQVGTAYGGALIQGHHVQELDRVTHPTTGVPTILWAVQAKIDSRLDPTQINSNPTDLRPKRRWYTEKVKENREVDLDQEPITTPADEPIAVEDDITDLVLEIERYENYPTDPALMYAFAAHTNEGTFYGAPEGTVLLDDIQSDEEFISQAVYIKTRYVFRFKLRWDASADAFETDTVSFKYILNQGFLYRPTAGALPVTFLDKNGQPVKVNLNPDGTINNTDTPAFTGFPWVPSVDFSILNLEF